MQLSSRFDLERQVDIDPLDLAVLGFGLAVPGDMTWVICHLFMPLECVVTTGVWFPVHYYSHTIPESVTPLLSADLGCLEVEDFTLLGRPLCLLAWWENHIDSLRILQPKSMDLVMNSCMPLFEHFGAMKADRSWSSIVVVIPTNVLCDISEYEWPYEWSLSWMSATIEQGKPEH